MKNTLTHLPDGFVYVKDIAPNIEVDLKYHGSDNFLGRPVDGYDNNIAILTREATEKIALVQAELEEQNLGLKILDAYRPHRACVDFWNWGEDAADTKMKAKFYPDFTDKKELFNGYIARYSKHSRGSTVDLTLVNLDDGKELEMGTIFDFLGELSHTDNEAVPAQAQKNRQLLKQVMLKHGFENYWREWWHFELQNEPFTRKPEDHFDFEIK